MRVLVCGDRHWKNKELIRKVLLQLWQKDGRVDFFVIEGAAPGADTLAHQVREEEGWPGRRFPADWAGLGKAAGPIRNQKMLDIGDPHLVLAFHNNLKDSKGTADMLRRARRAGIPIRLVKEKK